MKNFNELSKNEMFEIEGGYGWYPGFDAKAQHKAVTDLLHEVGDFCRGFING